MADFETDKEGNVETKPVTGWTITTAFGIAVVLQVEYQDAPTEAGGIPKLIPLVLTAPQCEALATALNRAADSIHQGQASGERPN